MSAVARRTERLKDPLLAWIKEDKDQDKEDEEDEDSLRKTKKMKKTDKDSKRCEKRSTLDVSH